MGIPDLDEMRVKLARNRAKGFFVMLSKHLRNAKEQEKKLKRRHTIQQEIDSALQLARKAEFPSPESSPLLPLKPSKPKRPADPVESDHPAQEFLRWCFGQGEYQREEPPPWGWRNRRLYRRVKW